MALVEGEGPMTSSYIESIRIIDVLSALFDCSRAALIFALLLTEITTIAVVEITTTVVKAVARRLVIIVHSALDSTVFAEEMLTTVGSPVLPVIFPQTTVCMANVHMLPLGGMPVQVALVWLVVVGQLPQFDARML